MFNWSAICGLIFKDISELVGRKSLNVLWLAPEEVSNTCMKYFSSLKLLRRKSRSLTTKTEQVPWYKLKQEMNVKYYYIFFHVYLFFSVPHYNILLLLLLQEWMACDVALWYWAVLWKRQQPEDAFAVDDKRGEILEILFAVTRSFGRNLELLMWINVWKR